MRTSSGIVFVSLMTTLGCGPSQAELASRESGRATITELRAAADAEDAAFREALASFDPSSATACNPSGIRADAAVNGQPPTNFAENRREERDQMRLPVTSQLRAELSLAAQLLDDEEDRFRWASGRDLADKARALLSADGYDLVLVADMRSPDTGLDTFEVDRLRGVMVGWSPGRDAIVCGAAFDAEAPASLTVSQRSAGTDVGRGINYRVREVAFAAAGFGEVEPSRYGAPSLF